MQNTQRQKEKGTILQSEYKKQKIRKDGTPLEFLCLYHCKERNFNKNKCTAKGKDECLQ
jgi:hypothetical protein